MNWRFMYRSQFVSAYDGDTPTLLLDLGLGLHVQRRVRVADLWCPELNEDGGPEARHQALGWFAARAQTDWPFLVELHKTASGKERRSFTRYVGDIYDADLDSFATFMVGSGHGTRSRH